MSFRKKNAIDKLLEREQDVGRWHMQGSTPEEKLSVQNEEYMTEVLFKGPCFYADTEHTVAYFMAFLKLEKVACATHVQGHPAGRLASRLVVAEPLPLDDRCRAFYS